MENLHLFTIWNTIYKIYNGSNIVKVINLPILFILQCNSSELIKCWFNIDITNLNSKDPWLIILTCNFISYNAHVQVNLHTWGLASTIKYAARQVYQYMFKFTGKAAYLIMRVSPCGSITAFSYKVPHMYKYILKLIYMYM